jgi:hypothetical protein
MFFILLGSHLVLENIGPLVNQALILSAFVLIGNPIIVLVLMNALGYKRKVGFMAGLTVAQISEFSLILAAMALSYGHITQEVVTLITLVGIITIAGSTYLILYADQIYNKLQNILKLFDIRRTHARSVSHGEEEHESLLFGYDRVGTYFTKAMEKLGTDYIVIDFNPSSIKHLKENNIPYRYGDAEDIDFLEELNLSKIKMIVSTIPAYEVNMTLLKYYRKVNPVGIIVLIAHNIHEAKELYLAGATYVVVPHNLGAHHAAKMVAQFGFDIEQFDIARNKHLSKMG